MAKRIKMPAIKPEKRLEWLKRSEKGETPPQIAAADDVDVRTVRKHINIALMERDVQQARSAVLRDVLEAHYRDLLDTVRNIQSQITAESPVPLEKDIPLMLGLKQHMPRSPLWENLRKWNRTIQELSELEGMLPQITQQEIEKDGRLEGIVSYDSNEVIPATIAVLVHQMKQWTRGSEGLTLSRNFSLDKASEDKVRAVYGFSHLGEIEESQVEIVKDVIQDIELKMKQGPEYTEMEKLVKRLSRLGNTIRELTTVILLRRIVPGKCKFCPL